MTSNTLKAIYIFFGVAFTAIGVVGIFLPLLPTTPFLLLAAFCFNRGSKKFHSWLLNHKVLGPPIHDWNHHRVIRTKYKVLATTMLVASLTVVALKESVPFIGKVSFAIFVVGMLVFIWTRKG